MTLTDTQTLNGATSRFGYSIKTYDDGFGPLWIHRGSMGISGIVRAQTWSDAYSICEDEFFPEASESMEEIIAEYGFKRTHVKMVLDGSAVRPAVYPDDYSGNVLKSTLQFVRWDTIETPDADAWSENELFQEGFGFRNNGPNARDVHKHGIYAKDLNGDTLEPLTDELIGILEITLDISESE